MAPANTFTITAAPGTDIWRKPPMTDVFNAPTALPSSSPTPLRASGPLTSFLSARISLNFTPQEQYDQGGLLLSFRRTPDSQTTTTTSASPPPPPKWIKTGIEFYNGRPRLSTVACDSWADWSVADLPSTSSSTSTGPSTTAAPAADKTGQPTGWTTLQIEKDKDGNGTGVWVYQVITDEEGNGGGSGAKQKMEKKVPLREICWVFGDQPESWEVEVRAMAARPEKAAQGGLVVEFAAMDVKWLS